MPDDARSATDARSAKASAERSGDRSLTGCTVLAVFAHPDDESLACGGTLARLADAGVKVALLCASRGEAGSISDPALVPDGDLGAVRTRELYDAAAVLGISEVIVGDHPDGDLRWDHVTELHNEIVDVVARLSPDAVITFAEDGLYWHLDHIAVHERTYTALRTFGAAAPALYYVTMAKGVMREIVEAAQAKGGSPPDSGSFSFWGIAPDAFGDAASPPSLTIDVREWVPRKLSALRCHKTQMGRNNPIAWIDEDEAKRWLGTEYFRRAEIGGSEAAVLESLGEYASRHA